MYYASALFYNIRVVTRLTKVSKSLTRTLLKKWANPGLFFISSFPHDTNHYKLIKV